MGKSAQIQLAETLILERKAGTLNAGRGTAAIDAAIEELRVAAANEALRHEVERFRYAVRIGVKASDWERLKAAAANAGLS